MGIKKLIGRTLESLPLILIIISIIASIYAANMGIAQVTYGSTIILVAIVILHFIGRAMVKSQEIQYYDYNERR